MYLCVCLSMPLPRLEGSGSPWAKTAACGRNLC